MKSKHQSRRFLRKSAVAGYLSLSLAFSCLLAVPAYAGPADDISLGTSEGPGQSGPGGGTVVADSSYYNQVISDPIVKPVDKYSYEQMEQDIGALAARYPGRVTVNVIGQSLDGRNIYDIIVGNPGAPKKLLLQGGIHAREYIITPLMMQQLEYMLAFYDTGTYDNQPLSSFLNQTSVHFVPMANPDGVAVSQFGEAAIRSEELRQTMQFCYAMDVAEARTALSYAEYLLRWKSNARGVDLNHNFDAGWAELNPALTHNSFTDYKGTAPLSEPEAVALAGLVQQNQFSAVINYHAMGRVIYWNTEANLTAARSLDMAQTAANVTGYQVLGSNGRGGFKDWLQQTGSAPSITIEVGRSACPVAFSEYQSIWDQNKQIPALFCKYVLTH